MDRLARLNFLNICLVFAFCSVFQAESALFNDLDKQRDQQFLEQIFKEHWELLASDYETHHYKQGKGVHRFMVCSNISGTDGSGKIVRLDGKTIGFVTFFIANQDFKQYDKIVVKKGEGCIPLMGIGSNYQKKGYGSVALLYILSELKKKNCKTVKLSVNAKNTGAQKLYSKFHFYNTGVSATDKKQKNSSSWWKLNNLNMLDLKKLIKQDPQ